MTDALAARQQTVGELFGRKARIARHVLEPLGRVARGVLQLEHFDPACRLVLRQGGLPVGRHRSVERVGQADRILHRQLGPRADREMRGMRGIAHQHDVLVDPARVADARKVQPIATAQVRASWPSAGDRRGTARTGRSQNAIVSSVPALSSPRARHVSSRHSTIKVLSSRRTDRREP